MSIRAINWALDQKTGSPTSKLVLFKLADQANDKGQCWPSQSTIAKQCEINRATVNRHIKRLSELGLVKIIPRYKDGVALPNVYELIGVGAEDHRGGRRGSQGVGAEDHTNPHIEPSYNPQEEDNPKKDYSSSGTPADCPHQAIIDLYHQTLPMLPQVREWTPARAQQLRTRWREDPERQTIDYWQRFFEYVKTSDFLCGRVTPAKGKKPFLADLEWLTKSANFTKVREGKYDNG